MEDSLHSREDERSSSPSIEFEPLTVGPEYVDFDHDQDSTSIFHDDSVEMENQWAMELSVAPTLESDENDSIDEHGTVIF